jgi:transcriptional regulator with XRE-family HTH domain
MPRRALTDQQRALGRALGAEIQERRHGLSATQVAEAAHVEVMTLRKLERGRVPTPGFFFIADIAQALSMPMDELAAAARLRAAEVSTEEADRFRAQPDSAAAGQQREGRQPSAEGRGREAHTQATALAGLLLWATWLLRAVSARWRSRRRR